METGILQLLKQIIEKQEELEKKIDGLYKLIDKATGYDKVREEERKDIEAQRFGW